MTVGVGVGRSTNSVIPGLDPGTHGMARDAPGRGTQRHRLGGRGKLCIRSRLPASPASPDAPCPSSTCRRPGSPATALLRPARRFRRLLGGDPERGGEHPLGASFEPVDGAATGRGVRRDLRRLRRHTDKGVAGSCAARRRPRGTGAVVEYHRLRRRPRTFRTSTCSGPWPAGRACRHGYARAGQRAGARATPPTRSVAQPSIPGFMTRGIRDQDNYYYRRVFTDAVRADRRR